VDQRIDITMTAVVRPAIVDQVLRSIVERICKEYRDYFRLIINIDPVGEKDFTQQDVLRVAREHFPYIKARMPDTPSFPLALRWCWEQAETEYVLHTEDDFKFAKDIDIEHAISVLDRHKKLAMLRFDRGTCWDNPEDDMGGQYIVRGANARVVKGKFERTPLKWSYHKDGFYLAPQWQGCLSTSPSISRLNYIRGVVPFIEDGLSPERITMFAHWLRGHMGQKKAQELREHLSKFESAIYAVPLAIRDLGRPWKKRHSFKKPDGNRGIGTTWIGGEK
jgi:hypothetical protein